MNSQGHEFDSRRRHPFLCKKKANEKKGDVREDLNCLLPGEEERGGGERKEDHIFAPGRRKRGGEKICQREERKEGDIGKGGSGRLSGCINNLYEVLKCIIYAFGLGYIKYMFLYFRFKI